MKIAPDWLISAPVVQLCQAFAGSGAQLWFVGGCVRDAILGRDGGDLDLCSDAPPERVIALAGAAGLKAVPTGIEHGTITVIVAGTPFEITTLRRDLSTDGRHAEVAWSQDLAEDAARRDFTMNALYATPEGAVLDPLGEGLRDLSARRLRFVGDAPTRIAEDYLRILRWFRFYAWFGDPAEGPDPEALAAIADGAGGLARISRERIGAEMRKLLTAPDPAPAMALMQVSGVLSQVLPGADAKALSLLVHLEAGAAPDWRARLAALGGEDAAEHLRLSRAEAKDLATLQRAMGLSPAEAAYRFGARVALQSQQVLQALMAQPLPEGLEAAIARGAEARFPIRAADLAERYQGPALGEALREREARFIASGFTLSRDDLL